MAKESTSGGNIVRNWWRYRYVQMSLRLVVGGAFVYAGILKLEAPEAFADSIASFQLLPAPLINITALALPAFESLAGSGLVIGWRRREFALGAFGMTAIFAFAIATALARGLRVDCGCFGSGEITTSRIWMSLGRDLLICLGSVTIYLANPRTLPEWQRCVR